MLPADDNRELARPASSPRRYNWPRIVRQLFLWGFGLFCLLFLVLAISSRRISNEDAVHPIDFNQWDRFGFFFADHIAAFMFGCVGAVAAFFLVCELILRRRGGPVTSPFLTRQLPGWREHRDRLAKELRDLKAGRRRLFHRKVDVTAEQIVAKSWELHCLRQLIIMAQGRRPPRRYLG